jgi:hypothetical protein
VTTAGSERRDFRTELRGVKCWDAQTQAVFDTQGEAVEDCVLQNREELIALCALIERMALRSWLEIGSWTGALTRCMDELRLFERLAVCDDGWSARRGLELRLPPRAAQLRGDSGSVAFERWRAALGPVDLVFIDANHAHHAVSRDFAVNRRHPHRLLAFHDITGANRHTTGVARFWRELREGHKLELLRPHVELGLDHSVMGIGLWAEHPFPGSEPA